MKQHVGRAVSGWILGLLLVVPSTAWALVWDPDMDALGVTLQSASPAPGQRYWELTEGYADDPVEGGGKINIFFKTMNLSAVFEGGVWVRTEWTTGNSDVQTKTPPDWGDFPMAGGNWCPATPPGPYSTLVLGRNPSSPDLSDRVAGMGLPCNEHWSFRLIFEEKIAASGPTPTNTPPAGATLTPTPVPTPPAGSARWALSYGREYGVNITGGVAGQVELFAAYENGVDAQVGMTNDANSGTAIFGYTNPASNPYTPGNLRVVFDLANSVYDFHAYDPPVPSDRSADCYWLDSLPNYGHYKFEFWWRKVSNDALYTFYPYDPVYHYDLVDGFNNPPNEPPGFNSDAFGLTNWTSYQAQTFVVPTNVNRIIGAKAFIVRSAGAKMTGIFSIRAGGPTGTQVGPSVTSREKSSNEWANYRVTWGMEDIPVTPGGTYALRVEATDAGGFNVYATNSDNYPGGILYNGTTAIPGRDMVAVVIGAWREAGGPVNTPTPTEPATPTPTQPVSGQNFDFETWNNDNDAAGWTEMGGNIVRGQAEIAYGDNPLVSGSPENVRVGAGWSPYSSALVQQVPVTPGVQYRLSGYGRFLHGTDLTNMWSGVNIGNQTMRMGYDLTGQTSSMSAGSITYTDMTAAGNNVWARYETTFTASGSTVSIWLHASQPTAEVGLCHFDDFAIEAISAPDSPTPTPTMTVPPPSTPTNTPVGPTTGVEGGWKGY